MGTWIKTIWLQRKIFIMWNSQSVHKEPTNAHLHRCTLLIKKKNSFETWGELTELLNALCSHWGMMTTQGNTVRALKDAVLAAMQHCWHSILEEEHYILNLLVLKCKNYYLVCFIAIIFDPRLGKVCLGSSGQDVERDTVELRKKKKTKTTT